MLSRNAPRPGGRWLRWLGGFLIFCLVFVQAVGMTPWPWLERLDWQAYDMRVRHPLFAGR